MTVISLWRYIGHIHMRNMYPSILEQYNRNVKILIKLCTNKKNEKVAYSHTFQCYLPLLAFHTHNEITDSILSSTNTVDTDAHHTVCCYIPWWSYLSDDKYYLRNYFRDFNSILWADI